MASHIDHLVVLAPDLDTGCAHVAQALGISPGPGRQHPHMGTHNRLLSLGPALYLEVMAIDPEAAPVARPRWFGLDQRPATAAPGLAAWVANGDDIAAHAEPELGPVETMARAGMTWQMTARPDGSPPFDGAGPLLIQRAGPTHPAAVLPPTGLALRQLRLVHPRAAELRSLLQRIGLADARLDVQTGRHAAISAVIETPQGLRTL